MKTRFTISYYKLCKFVVMMVACVWNWRCVQVVRVHELRGARGDVHVLHAALAGRAAAAPGGHVRDEPADRPDAGRAGRRADRLLAAARAPAARLPALDAEPALCAGHLRQLPAALCQLFPPGLPGQPRQARQPEGQVGQRRRPERRTGQRLRQPQQAGIDRHFTRFSFNCSRCV